MPSWSEILGASKILASIPKISILRLKSPGKRTSYQNCVVYVSGCSGRPQLTVARRAKLMRLEHVIFGILSTEDFVHQKWEHDEVGDNELDAVVACCGR